MARRGCGCSSKRSYRKRSYRKRSYKRRSYGGGYKRRSYGKKYTKLGCEAYVARKQVMDKMWTPEAREGFGRWAASAAAASKAVYDGAKLKSFTKQLARLHARQTAITNASAALAMGGVTPSGAVQADILAEMHD